MIVRRRLILFIAVLGLITTAVGLLGFFLWLGGESEMDRKPIPRPVKNAPFVTTPNDVVDQMLDLAEVGRDDLLYDLGCGDGRIVIRAASTRKCRARGFDLDAQLVARSRKNAAQAGVGELSEFSRRDVLTLDLREASIVTIYLLPALNTKLVPQLKKLKPGSRIVSHDFPIGGLRPDRELIFHSSQDDRDHVLYLFRVPLTLDPAATSR